MRTISVTDLKLAATDSGGGGDGLFLTRPRGAHLHPLRQVGDLFGGQLRWRRRHRFEVGIGVRDGLEKKAILNVAGHDGLAVVAAGEGVAARVETQAAALLGGTVALETIVGQDGADVALEELHRFRRGRSRLVRVGRRRADRASQQSQGRRTKASEESSRSHGIHPVVGRRDGGRQAGIFTLPELRADAMRINVFVFNSPRHS